MASHQVMRTKAEHRRGAAAVELAIVAPLLLLIFMGTVELCNTIFLEQTLKTAAFEGARTSIVPGANTYDIETKVREVTDARGIRNVSVAISPSNFEDAPIGTFIRIEVTAPHLFSRYFSTKVNSSGEIVESVSMMKEY